MIILKRAKNAFLKYDTNKKIQLSNHIIGFDIVNGKWIDLYLAKSNKQLEYRVVRFKNVVCAFQKSHIKNRVYLNIIHIVYLMIAMSLFFWNQLESIWKQESKT